MSAAAGPPSGLAATRLEIDSGGIAWLTLDRPQVANARNQQMRDELGEIYQFLAASTKVRVLVLHRRPVTGHFCAGMDLKEAGGAGDVAGTTSTASNAAGTSTAGRSPACRPSPAINGVALGGGLEMALACDLRIVAGEASLGLPELTHGLVPGGGGTQRLPRLIGTARTLELLYLARRITGEEAVVLGVATSTVPRASLREETWSVARRIAELDPAAVRSAKVLVKASSEMALQAGLALELDALLTLLDQRR